MKKQQNPSKPFFTQFLEKQEQKEENQLSIKEKEYINGGGTLKYPSDRDEDADPIRTR